MTHRIEESIKGNYLKPCACGQCGILIWHKNIYGTTRNYVRGHSFTGKKHTEESKRKIRQFGENNKNWVGDKVSKRALHKYIRRHLPKPKLCPVCNERPPFDVANINPIYNPETYIRDLTNWEWLCRRCHMISDGRMTAFLMNMIQNKR